MYTAETDAPDPALNIPPDDTTEGHRLRTRTIWAVAQYDYLQGDTAEQVCDRYGLAITTFRDRARKEKWRRMDQPEPPLPPVEEDDPADDEPVDCQALSDDALTRVRRALRKGRATEAASWMRLHEKLENRLEAQRERVRRRERVEQAHGSASGPVAIDPIQRMKVLAAAARTQIALEQALTAVVCPKTVSTKCRPSIGGARKAWAVQSLRRARLIRTLRTRFFLMMRMGALTRRRKTSGRPEQGMRGRRDRFNRR